MIIETYDGFEPVISGDVHFVFKHRGGVLGDPMICRVAFNTAFIPYNNTLTLKKTTVSPDKVKKDSRFKDDFIIKLIFEDYCKKCN